VAFLLRAANWKRLPIGCAGKNERAALGDAISKDKAIRKATCGGAVSRHAVLAKLYRATLTLGGKPVFQFGNTAFRFPTRI
jgi:hypothetical protein